MLSRLSRAWLDVLLHNSIAPVTFLTSRRNGLVSVYDVARSGVTIRMSSPAYSLPCLRSPDGGNLGRVFIQHPHSTNFGDLSVLQLSELGAVHMMHLRLSDNTQQESGEGGPTDRNWSEEVEELEERVQAPESAIGPLGMRAFTEANLRPAYESKLITSFPVVLTLKVARRGLHESDRNHPT